jgi:hypothetical protein
MQFGQSHSIWYTSSRNPVHSSPFADTNSHPHHGFEHNTGDARANSARRPGQLLLEQSQLARLRADEQQMDRRRMNIQNFGSGWLKPPGVSKTLHQLREEKREQEEHQEALRREALAQELADAEAVGQDAPFPEEGMDDVQLEEARDLDDDIPDADAGGFGMDGADDDDDDDDGDDDDENEDEDEDVILEGRQNDLMAARMRATDDASRAAMARGGAAGEDMYDGEDDIEEEGPGNMLDEDDFIHIGGPDGMDDGMDMDMDANLDDDIPEAESGVYEHTDSEAELSSSLEEEDDEDEDEEVDISFVARTAPLGPPQSPTLQSRSRGARDDPRTSMDLSSILSRDGSSIMGSSPQVGRRQ